MKKRIADETLRKWAFWFSLVAAAIVLYKSFERISDVFGLIGSLFSLLTPVVVAFCIAFFLNRPMGFVERLLKRAKKVPFVGKHARGLAVTIVYILFLALIVLICYAIVPALISGITSLISNSDLYIEKAAAWFAGIAEKYPYIAELDIGDTLLGWVKSFIASINVDTIIGYLESIGSVGSTLADIAVSLFVSIYMLLDKESLCSTLRRISGLVLKERTIGAIANYLHRMEQVVYRYFATQFGDCVIVSVLATIALSILDAPSPVLLGFVFGMFNIIPYFGPIIGGVGVVVVILFTRGFGVAVTAAVILLVLQQVDANVINPRILGASMEIGPFWVIVAITFGGGLFGFAGMLLGVPMLVVVRMLYRDALRFKKRWKEWKENEDAAGERSDDLPEDGQEAEEADRHVPEGQPENPADKKPAVHPKRGAGKKRRK